MDVYVSIEKPDVTVEIPNKQWPAWASVHAYVHEQSTASNLWTVQHNLWYKPAAVQVQDYQWNTYSLFPVNYIDANSITIEFWYALAGFAYIL